MTTFFGTLIQGFVNFEIVVEQAKFGDVQAQAQIPIAAVQFRHAAAKRATYLVYLSELSSKLVRNTISFFFQALDYLFALSFT